VVGNGKSRSASPHQPFVDPVRGGQRLHHLEQRVIARRRGHANLTQRSRQARQMEIGIEQSPLKHGRHFVHPISEEDATIEDGKLRFRLGDELAVDPAGAHDGNRRDDMAWAAPE